MRKWPRRGRAAAGLGLTWAVAWVPFGLLMGWVFGGNRVTPDEFPLDDWITPMASLGFLGGATFSMVLGIADGRRRFDQLSLTRFGAWGALGGLIAGVLAVAMWHLDRGLGPVLWDRATLLISSSILLSAISASGTLALARKAEVRGSLGEGEEADHTGTPKDQDL